MMRSSIITGTFTHKTLHQQQKYHSFIVISTSSKQLAQKWNYYVLSNNGQLLMNTDDKKNNQNVYLYLISIDAVAYTVNHNDSSNSNSVVVLGEGNWVKQSLSQGESKLLKQHKMVVFDSLDISKLVRFYYYISNGKQSNTNVYKINNKQAQQNALKQLMIQNGENFIQVTPKYLHCNDCLIFPISSTQTHHIKQLHAKNIKDYALFTTTSLSQAAHQKQNQQMFFSFRSEYALVSDQHFLNCLVRGKKSICSYFKVQQGYVFWIDPDIYQALLDIYVRPKL